MKHRRDKSKQRNETICSHLEQTLASAGWEITDRFETNLTWWVNRVWVLRSTWSPVGLVVRVSILVEPEGADIYAFAADTTEPSDRFEAGKVALSEFGDWKTSIDEFINLLSAWRDRRSQA